MENLFAGVRRTRHRTPAIALARAVLKCNLRLFPDDERADEAVRLAGARHVNIEWLWLTRDPGENLLDKIYFLIKLTYRASKKCKKQHLKRW